MKHWRIITLMPVILISGLGFLYSCGGGGSGGSGAGIVGELLLTEIVVRPDAGELVEIFNPNSSTVDLSDYYLTDATWETGGLYYYNIVTGANAGGGSISDFHARFPDGASIEPGEYQTVSLAGSSYFFTTYGVNPTYELYEDDVTADSIPDMREALPGSINNQGNFSTSGEVIILYYWDGIYDLVYDIDYVVWGDLREAVDKTGVALDGPDANIHTTNYLNDWFTLAQNPVDFFGHALGASFQRSDYTEGTETKTGGNGLTGHNETSENLSATWGTGVPTPNY